MRLCGWFWLRHRDVLDCTRRIRTALDRFMDGHELDANALSLACFNDGNDA